MSEPSARLPELRGAKLDLGCGNRKYAPDYVGVDELDTGAADIVADVWDVLSAIPDASISAVYASHFLEHVDDVTGLLVEIARVLELGAEAEIIVPHFSNPYFYSDLTHRHPFGLYSLAYLLETSPFSRQVPNYGHVLPMQLRSTRLVFKSPPPFYVRYGIKRLVDPVVNLGTWTQEFYEENFAFLCPCYELRFVLKRT